MFIIQANTETAAQLCSLVIFILLELETIRNLHEYRYDVRALTNCGLRNRVIYVRESLPKDSTLDQNII